MRAIIPALLSLLLISPFAPAAELRVGAAAVVITPPEGTPMAGYYSLRSATGVHDDLYAKTMVVEQAGARVALVVCDLISLSRPTVEAARRRIAEVAGLPGERVMISATHTHTGPRMSTGSARDAAFGGRADLAGQYNDALPDLIAKSVKQAIDRLAPAKLMAGRGQAPGLAFNRRKLMKDGTVGWNVKRPNADIVRPAGPTDADVPLLYAESLDGKAIATYVNFAIHLDVVGGTEISADFPHPLATHLARAKGADMVTLFSIGTAGDINHVDSWKGGPQKGFDEAERIGAALAEVVTKSYPQLRPINAYAPRVRSERVTLALPPVTDAEVAEARQIAVKFGKGAPGTVEKARAFKVLDVAARKGKPLEVEVQVVALAADVAIVSLPGEIFVELGLAIKQGSPFAHTTIATLANGSIGYIPTERAYREGNYEPLSARCASGSGEKLVEVALRLLKDAKANPTPAAQAADPKK